MVVLSFNLLSMTTMRSDMAAHRPRQFRATSQDMMNYISRGIADQQLHFVIRCAGSLDPVRLRKAVDLCIVVQPVLGCVYVEEGRRPYWREAERTEGYGSSETTPSDIEQELNQFILTPIDPRKDPLVQVRLFRGRTDILCIKMNHVCADAAGTRNYGYLLVDIYNALAADPSFMPKEDRRERGMRSVLKQYGLMERIGFARTAMRFMRKANKQPGRSWQFPAVSSSNDGRTIAIRRMAPDRVRKLSELAKRRSATLNDVILTAYFRSLFRIIKIEGDDPVPLQVSADLRRYNTEETCDIIANMSSAIFAAIPPVHDEPFETTLQKVKAVMDRMKEKSPLIGAYAIAIPFRIMNYRKASMVMHQMTVGRAQKGIAMPLLSNFGKLDPERLDLDGKRPVDAYITTPIMYPPYLMLGVTGYDGSLTFTSGHCQAGVGDGVERMLDIVLEELPK
jgi:NRPS condensation-like uncharacterized protein